MSDDKQEQDMLTTAEVLAMLSISRPTLYRFMDEGVLTPANYNPVLVKQKRLLFKRGDVERLKREGRKSS